MPRHVHQRVVVTGDHEDIFRWAQCLQALPHLPEFRRQGQLGQVPGHGNHIRRFHFHRPGQMLKVFRPVVMPPADPPTQVAEQALVEEYRKAGPRRPAEMEIRQVD